MLSYSFLPHLNAILNGMSALMAAAGFISIRRKRRNLHRALMVSALALSVLFLTSYLVYHAKAGSVRLQKEGWIRPAYFTILVSHSALAVLVLPLAAVSLKHALTQRFGKHRRIARWTLPVWIYVSITGILVYLILYW